MRTSSPAPVPGGIPVTVMRGGTSKGVFIEEKHLPVDATERAALFLDLMGSPDSMQLDGLGGSHSSTSKIISLSASTAPDTDVDYRFAQVGIDTAEVDEVGNCGNLTAAVGPYAVDAGWVTAVEPITTVRLRNLNTGKRIRALVPVAGGRAATTGGQRIPGVPSPGPRVVTEYADPVGAVFDTALPTGSACDLVELDGRAVPVSVVDVVHPVAFAHAADAGYPDGLAPAEANARPELLDRLERLRAACAALLPGTGRPPSRNLPRLVLLRAADAGPEPADLHVVGVSAGRVHHALPVTSTLCAAAAATLAGTLPAASSGRAAGQDRAAEILIAHPKGVVAATVEPGDDSRRPVRAVGLVRTARRLLDGTAHLRDPGLAAGALTAAAPARPGPGSTTTERHIG